MSEKKCIEVRPAAEFERWPNWQYGKPPEHESIFYKFKDTNKWRPGMFEMTSGEVLVTFEVPGGRRYVVTDCTIDGKWRGGTCTPAGAKSLRGQSCRNHTEETEMRVLIACEESQEVCKAFRALKHEAYSCDIQEPSGGHPEWHIFGDALMALRGGKS